MALEPLLQPVFAKALQAHSLRLGGGKQPLVQIGIEDKARAGRR